MSRSLKVVIEQDDDLNHTAWFRELPDKKVTANSLDELWTGLFAVMEEFKANGGDATTLAVEDDR